MTPVLSLTSCCSPAAVRCVAGRRSAGSEASLTVSVAGSSDNNYSTLPKVAVVPIFVLWFGSGTVPAVLTALTTCIFPIVVNVATGLATTEPEMEDVLKALGASRMQVLWNVSLPRAMPYFFASLKVAVTLAFVGTVLSETVASNLGIGTVIMMATSSFDVPLAFAGLFALAFLGIALYSVFAVIEQRVCGWANRKQEFAMG